MRLALINSNADKIYLGSTQAELVNEIPGWTFNQDKRCLVMDCVDDTVSFSKEFTHEELQRELVQRLLKMMKNRGWELYYHESARFR